MWGRPFTPWTAGRGIERRALANPQSLTPGSCAGVADEGQEGAEDEQLHIQREKGVQSWKQMGTVTTGMKSTLFIHENHMKGRR